jgi:hypothetical protein
MHRIEGRATTAQTAIGVVSIIRLHEIHCYIASIYGERRDAEWKNPTLFNRLHFTRTSLICRISRKKIHVT